jgi:hypothetical protein
MAATLRTEEIGITVQCIDEIVDENNEVVKHWYIRLLVPRMLTFVSLFHTMIRRVESLNQISSYLQSQRKLRDITPAAYVVSRL